MQRKLNNQMKELNYQNMASFINMAGAAGVDSHACKTSNDAIYFGMFISFAPSF